MNPRSAGAILKKKKGKLYLEICKESWKYQEMFCHCGKVGPRNICGVHFGVVSDREISICGVHFGVVPDKEVSICGVHFGT